VPLEVFAQDLKPASWKGRIGIGEGQDPASCSLGPVPPGAAYPGVGLEYHPVSVLQSDLDGPVI